MEYPKYLKLKTVNFYVKLIDENNNIHIRRTIDGWSMDKNGSPNESYPIEDFEGCSRQEFDNEYKKIVESLNEISKL